MILLAAAILSSAALADPAAPGDPAGAGTFWAFRPIRKVAVPEVRDRSWPRNPVDRFILARLEESGLRPAPPASPEELIRRLHFDLTGLPPGPQEVAAFAADGSDDAYERLVDRLLASPRHGERWAQH